MHQKRDFTRILRWLPRYAARRWRGCAVVLLITLLQSGLEVLKPWPMQLLVDHVMGSKPLPASIANGLSVLMDAPSRETLLVVGIAAMVALFLLGWALRLVSDFQSTTLGQRMVYDLATDLFSHLAGLSLRFHFRRPIGDSIRRITTDCGCVSIIIKDAALPVLTSLFSLVTMFVIMWRLNSTLTLLTLGVLPFMVWVFRRYGEPMMERSYEQHEVEGQIFGVVEQTLSAIPVVQAFQREPHNDARFAQTTDSILSAAQAATRVQLLYKILMGFGTATATAGVLWIGAQHVLGGRLTLGTLLVFLSYLSSLLAPLQAIMYASATLQGAAGSARRVFEVLETEPEVRDLSQAVALPPLRHNLQLENITFGYEASRPVLRELNLEVLAGQTVAIVGPSGAGKSTLVSLLPRFFDPWQGRVLIDGHDVRDVQLDSLRQQIALVLQEPLLFPLTVAENIAYGRPEASQAEIEAAARAANAHDFIQRLPQGYETPVGEGGTSFSRGERQRLSIARAFLKDAPILILDEPTSALDTASEALLLEALARLVQGRTTLIIAHRLSTIQQAQQIVVMQEGRIVQKGSHYQLLEQGGLYAHLHSIQFGDLEAAADALSRAPSP